jgi:hypothetical protein
MKVSNYFAVRHQFVNYGAFAVLQGRLNVQRQTCDPGPGLAPNFVKLLLIAEIIDFVFNG